MSHLEPAVRHFSSDPVRCGQVMRDLLAHDSLGFRTASVELLDSFEDTPGFSFLLRLLGDADLIVLCLLEAASRDKSKLPQIIDATQRVCAGLQAKLGDLLAQCPADIGAEQQRLIFQSFHLIEASESKLINLRLLKRLLVSPNSRVRSKAAILFGQNSSSPLWATEVLTDGDARVRANAVEALWGVDAPEAVMIYRRAVADQTPRVAANALVGLYLAGKAEALEGIDQMARHTDSRRRASAAWAMGRTGDRRFISSLRRLVQDQDSLVRANAIRAATRIRRLSSQTTRETTADLVVVQAVNGIIRFVMAAGSHSTLPAISPLSTTLEIDAIPVLNYTLEECTAPDRKAIAVLVPNQPAGRQSFMESFRKATLARRPDDTWAVLPYSSSHTQPSEAPASGGEGASRPAGAPILWLRDNTALQRVFSERGPIEDTPGGLLQTTLASQRSLQAMRFERHIILLLPDPDTDPGPSDMVAQIQEIATKEKIVIHAILSDELSPNVTLARELCLSTGGLVASVSSPAALDSLLRGLAAHHILRFKPTESQVGAAVLAVDSGNCLAKVELSIPCG